MSCFLKKWINRLSMAMIDNNNNELSSQPLGSDGAASKNQEIRKSWLQLKHEEPL
jgi:hypothetical protein